MTNEEKIKTLEAASKTGQSVDFELHDGTAYCSCVRSDSKGNFFFYEMGESAADEGKVSAEDESIDVDLYRKIELSQTPSRMS